MESENVIELQLIFWEIYSNKDKIINIKIKIINIIQNIKILDKASFKMFEVVSV